MNGMCCMNERDNVFTGVNPLLMSRLQARGEFEGFHNYYLIELANYLNEVLPSNYQANPEAKLTLLYRHFANPTQPRKPDITIERNKTPYSITPTLEETVSDLTIPLDEVTLEDEEMVVLISQMDNEFIPLVVIEMLSPSNKIGRGKLDYLQKRKEFLQNNLVLLEIDLLHATPSPIEKMPIYPYHDDATPYYIALSNPNLENPHTAVYRFGINQILPKIKIPLSDGDSVLCDFDAIYQSTFFKGRYAGRVNYADTPMELGAYRQSDQMTILSHLAKIRDTAN